MRFRGITLTGEPYEFVLADCPIQLNDKMIALSNKPESPLLHSQSLARMDDEGTLAEFDLVYDSSNYKVLGFILYRNEFGVYDHKNDMFTRLRDLNCDYGIMRNKNINYVNLINGKMQSIQWRIGDVTFSVYEMLKVLNGYVYCFTKFTRPLDITAARLCTGLKKDKKNICYGDILSGGIVTLHNYRPMIKVSDDVYRDFMEDEIDGV